MYNGGNGFDLVLLDPHSVQSIFVPKYFSGTIGVFRDVCVTFGGEYLFSKSCTDTIRFGFSTEGYLIIQVGDHPILKRNRNKDTLIFEFGGNRSVSVFRAKVNGVGRVYDIQNIERFCFYDQIDAGKSYEDIQKEFREFLKSKFDVEL